jgi:hypothetical protein
MTAHGTNSKASGDMKCPNCQHEWTPTSSELASELGRRTSAAKTEAARANAKLGGWPKGKKRKKSRKPRMPNVQSDRIPGHEENPQ